MDSQSVKNTDSAENKGYDSGKKVSGIKRHIAVDTQGLPHAIHVTTANVTDRAGALAMFDRRRANLSQVQNVLVDGGYTGKPFATAVQSLLGASVEVVKRNELHTFVVLPKRWVVERSFGWLEQCRRLWKLDFTQNPGKVMDDITFVRSHWWLVSEGFSLSTANSDVQKLPATLYHRIADSLAYAA